MMCRKPFVRGMSAFGCGQCMPCRFNRRRLWTHRLMLEALVSPSASFVTLTYNDEELPDGGSLVPAHLQLWLKKYRKNFGPVRYYAVGEYGDFSERPHYHVALFAGDGCVEPSRVKSTWRYGYSYVGELTVSSAQYICGYVTKKLTKKDDIRLGGRYPEFARMSLKPGIGAVAIGDVAAALQNKAGWDEIEKIGDVPMGLRHGRSVYPIGRYLRQKLRKAMNFEEVKESDEAAYRRTAEMLVMYKDYLLAEGKEALGLKDMLFKEGAQKALQIEKRVKLLNAKKGVGI